MVGAINIPLYSDSFELGEHREVTLASWPHAVGWSAMLAALSKVTWPHLLLACSKHTPYTDKQRTITHEWKAVKYLQSCTACLGAVCLKDTAVRSLFGCLCQTMSEIRSAAASSIHAARRSPSARQRYQTPCRRHGNKPTSANHNPSPPISPGNCRSAGAPRTRTLSYFASCNVLSL